MMNEVFKSLVRPIIQDGYMLSSCGRIKSSIDETIPIYEPSYHSSNGYDYEPFIIKEEYRNKSTLRMFPIDDLICMTFIPIPDELKGKRVKVNHIDGNTRNNYIDNLEWIEDIEEWRNIRYSNIKPDTYEVSNWGRIRNIATGYIMCSKFDKDGYIELHFPSIMYHKRIYCRAHRIVAYEFYHRVHTDDLTVNHIDGNKVNNNVKNIEWCTNTENQRHAWNIGLKLGLKSYNSPRSSLTKRQIEALCDIIVKNDKSVPKIMNEIKHVTCLKDIPKDIVRSVVNKSSHASISDKYFSRDDFRHRFRESEINELCKLIIKNNFNVDKTFQEFNDGRNLRIPRRSIVRIINKEMWTSVSDKFF